jgi:hypothetical protein
MGQPVAETHPFEQAFEPLGGCHLGLGSQMNRIGIAAPKVVQLDGRCKSKCFHAARETLKGGGLMPVLDAADGWCGDARANRELGLGNASLAACLAQNSPKPWSFVPHNGYVNRRRSAFGDHAACLSCPEVRRERELRNVRQ